jgi:hypothetical protein
MHAPRGTGPVFLYIDIKAKHEKIAATETSNRLPSMFPQVFLVYTNDG